VVEDVELGDELLARLPADQRALVQARLVEGHLASWARRDDRSPLQVPGTLPGDLVARALGRWAERELARAAEREGQWAEVMDWLGRGDWRAWPGLRPVTFKLPASLDESHRPLTIGAICEQVARMLLACLGIPVVKAADLGCTATGWQGMVLTPDRQRLLPRLACDERKGAAAQALSLLQLVEFQLPGLVRGLPSAIEVAVAGDGAVQRIRPWPGARWTTAVVVTVSPGEQWSDDHWMVVLPIEPLPPEWTAGWAEGGPR
jgi:hypothetical protein